MRDIALSREKWKEKAKQLEASLQEKELQIEELKKTRQQRNQSKVDLITVDSINLLHKNLSG
ncbi:MAG: hypothetical protein QNJ60_10675 [Xenococcaceae cyanobacterium MO_188.B19]|nr:hypothetical protein [Xenococcaceae cyanobacterium MO_188.B19]